MNTFITLAAVYLILFWLVRAFENLNMYGPNQEILATPENYQMEYESHMIPSSKGNKIHLWFFPKEGAKLTVLYCHGNAGNIASPGRLYTVRQFLQLGCQVCLFDYQGFGKSEGSPSEKNTYADAFAVEKFLKEEKNVSPENLVVFGRSLGGAVAIHLAKHNPPVGLIVEATFCSTLSVAKKVFPILCRIAPLFLLRDKYTSKQKITKISCPLLVFYGDRDQVIPPENTVELYEASDSDKRLVCIEGACHEDVFLIDEKRYVKEIQDFLEKLPCGNRSET